ncbi:unnamed protein product [Pylaiella littoralis]
MTKWRGSSDEVLVTVFFAFSLVSCGNGLYELCTGNVLTVGDGVCDTSNNVALCEFDGGDCCPSTRVSCAEDCTEDTRNCLNPSASDYPYSAYPNCTSIEGNLIYIQDAICDEVNNYAQCGYDGGDCCPSTCILSDNSYCPEDNSLCADPSAVDFGWPGYENCTGYLPRTGNGLCYMGNNNAECGYDGGDCCECSCVPGRFLCVDRFNCLDPAMNNTECDTSSMVCSPSLQMEWVVEDTAGALELANAINCSGGTFNVEWRGHVVVTQTLWVTESTILNVTGVEVGASPAIADGGREVQIFSVVNASLNLHDMILTNAYGIVGGAVFAVLGALTFSGETSFVNNTADEFGGALSLEGGTISWDGDMTFADNSCTWDGGAINARAVSASWSGNTTFVGNRIHSFGYGGGYSFGGAIFAYLESNVSWTGQTSFVDNRVDIGDVNREVICEGGAVALDSNSSATWSGKTTFEDNEACYCGGALYANESTFSWTNETVFSNNRALSGGAVCIEWWSGATWSSPTTFVGNSVSDNGGAIYAADVSSVAWSGHTLFDGNSARDGGAVHVGGTSTLSWEGATAFEGNVASGSGGGLLIGEGVEASWTGQTNFSHNHADLNGGAVVSSLDSVTEATETYISVNGSNSFVNNSCGNYGGALMVSGAVSLSILSEDISFHGNTAGSAGGAVSLTGVEMGPTFSDIRFVSNSAQIGGAMYSTGSGTTISASGLSFPVTYERCNFTENWATASGGAVESAAGRDLVNNSTFVGNFAGQGGAMRLAGSVSLSDCWFSTNRADVSGGSAISNVGITENIQSCSFFSNDVLCGTGFFLDFVNGDRYSEVCSGCEPCAGDCDIANSTDVPTCTDTPAHTASTGDSIVLATIVIDSGYWRATPSSRDILACHNPDACLGGETGAADYCAEGYEGPYCAVCADGYAESLSSKCSSCSDQRARIAAMVLLPITVILGLVFLGYMMSKERDDRPAGHFHRLKQLLPLQSLKIVIIVWQILTEFSSVATVSFPDAYERFLDEADVLNFDFGWVLSAGCFVEIGFHERVITSTVGPIVALTILGLTYVVACLRNRSSRQALQKVRRKHVSVALWITFLVYSSVSSTIAKTFSCETLDDGKTYLRADYRIECTSSKHRAMQVYAGFMVAVYPLGIPLVYAALLFWGRDALKIAATQNTEKPRMQAAAHLASPYRPGCFYYEVIECARRVLLTGIVVFFCPDDPSHVAVTLVIACMFALVFEALAPYDSKWDTWTSRSGHVIVLLSIFIAVLLVNDISAEDSESQDLYGGALLAINVGMVMAVLVQGVIMAWSVNPIADALPRSVSQAAVGFDVEEYSSGRRRARTGIAIEEAGSSGNTNNVEGKRTSAVVGVGAIVARSGRSFRRTSHFPDPDHDDESVDRNLVR